MSARRFVLGRADRAVELERCTARNSCRRRRKIFLVHGATALAVVLSSGGAIARAEEMAPRDARTRDLQRLVDSLRDRMGIAATVVVTMVERDARTLSVRRSAEESGVFALSAERRFVESLTADQVEAALAHELGHVWIYTHHPYLQTEQLANRVAMRAVPRERLVEVYHALWGEDAVHGKLESFLGVQ